MDFVLTGGLRIMFGLFSFLKTAQKAVITCTWHMFSERLT
jgi:hypothetical protein